MGGVAVAIAVWCIVQLQESERETRMLEYYVMELDGKLMKSGFLDSSESWSAKQEKRK